MKKEKRKNRRLFFYALAIVLILLFFLGVYLSIFNNFSISGKVVADSASLAVYVSNSGSDTYDGTIDRPFLTLEAARAKIRQLKLAGELTSDVNVYLREGIYFLNQTFSLDERDFSSGIKINYLAYPGEKVVISGGKVLNNTWQLYSGNIYSMHVDSNFSSLFYGFDRLTRARSPNIGTYTGTSSSSSADKKYAFNFASGNINGNWKNLKDVELVSYILWEQNRFKINTVSGSKVNLAGGMETRWGNDFASDYSGGSFRYYVDNVFEGLDSPGEWYLDKTTGTLYYWPRTNDELNGTFIAPVVNRLLSVQGTKDIYVANVSFRDLVFAHSDWIIYPSGYKGSQAGIGIYSPSAILFNHTTDCQFVNNVVTLVGAYALDSNSQRLNISGNEFYNLGAGAIRVGQEDKYANGSNWENSIKGELLAATNNSITNNKIHDIGQVFKEGVGIWIALSGYNRVENNLVYNTTYSGISVGWKWGQSDTPAKSNVISKNIVHDVMRELNDGAAIYTLGKQPSTVIRYNLLYNVVHTSFHSFSACSYCLQGIHMDEGSSSITVHNNVIYNTFNGMVLNGGSGDVIQNNLFAYQSNYILFWNNLNTVNGKSRFENNNYFGLSGSFKYSTTANDATFESLNIGQLNALPVGIFSDSGQGPQYGVSVNLNDYKFLFNLQTSLPVNVNATIPSTVTNPSSINNSFEDSDGDGITDNLDRCSSTSNLTSVNNYGCPLPIWNNFKDYSSKIENQDLNSVSNFNISTSNGSILFSDPVSLIGQNSPLNLDANIHIEKNKISLNSNNLNALNKSAILIFYNVTVISPKILIDGRDCFECTILSYGGGIMKISVPHFSTFEVIEASTYNASSVNNSNSTCVPNWNCGSWGDCQNSLKTRSCADLNNCNVNSGLPSTSEGCSTECVVSWKCSAWSSCLNQVQTRTCSQENNCSSYSQKPVESRECRTVKQVLGGNNSYAFIFIILLILLVLVIIYLIYRYYSIN